MYIQYIENNSHKNSFFIFLFFNSLIAKLDGNALPKNKIVILFPIR